MAIGTAGPLVAGVSGTVGCCVFRSWGARSVIGQSPVKSVKGGKAVGLARARMQHVLGRWGALTDGQRRVWDAFGERVEVSSGRGPVRHPSGRALYMKHMMRWCFQEPNIAEMEPEGFVTGVPSLDGLDAVAGSYTNVTWTGVITVWRANFWLARSHSRTGWSRVCFRFVKARYFSVPTWSPLDLRGDQLAVLGEFGVGERIRMRVQWLHEGWALTPEPVYYDGVVG